MYRKKLTLFNIEQGGFNLTLIELSVLPGRVRFKTNKTYRNKLLSEYIDMYTENLYGVKYSNVNYNTGTILVVYDETVTSLKLIKNSIQQALSSEIDYKIESFDSSNPYYETKKRKNKAKVKFMWSSLIYLLFKIKQSIFGKFLISSSIGILETASIITIIGGYPLFKSLYKKYTKHIPHDSELLLKLAAVSITILRESTEGIFLIALINFTNYIKLSSDLKCQRLLKSNLIKPPNTAWIITSSGDEILTSVNSLQINDIISVHKGEVIPINGEVIDGYAMVNTLYYIGKSVVSSIRQGTKVYEGLIVLSGDLKIRVLNIPETFNKNDLPFDKLSLNDKIVKFQDKIVPVAMGLAAITYLFTGNILNALSVIVVLCPESSELALSTGIQNYSYLLNKYNIYIRNPNTFEKVINTDSIVFDKTGTLTYSNTKFTSIESFNSNYTQEIIRDGAYDLIDNLEYNGITNISMLTGDHYDKAKYISDKLGISNTYGDCDHEEKLKIIEQQKLSSTVMMVGDGINDVLSMRSADVSVSFANSSCDKIKLNSDYIIFEEDLNRLGDLIMLSKSAYTKINNNIKIANLYNIIFGMLASLGSFDIFAAKSINTINSILVLVLNERIKFTVPRKKLINKENKPYLAEN